MKQWRMVLALAGLGLGAAVGVYVGAQDGPGPDPGPGAGSPAGSAFSTQYNAGSSLFGGAGPGSSGEVLTSNGAGMAPSYQAAPSSPPGGADTNVQYNDGGAFGGEAAFTYNETTDVVSAPTHTGTLATATVDGAFVASSTAPHLILRKTNAAANGQYWRVGGFDGSLALSPMNDAGGTDGNAFGLLIDRGASSGTATSASLSTSTFIVLDVGGGNDEISLGNGTVGLNGTITAGGQLNGVDAVFDPGGGTDELTVASGAVTMAGTVTTNGSVGQGSGLKHQRVTTGSIDAAMSAAVTLTWTSAFADANYTLDCSVIDATAAVLALTLDHIQSASASAVVVRISNTSAGALTGTLGCIALHD